MLVSVYYGLIIAIISIANCQLFPADILDDIFSLDLDPRPLILPRWSDFCVRKNSAIRRIENDCLAKYHLTQYKTYDYPNQDAAGRNKIHCVENCIYEKFGAYDSSHKLNATASKTVLPPYSFDCLDKCADYTNSDHCMQSYCITQCIYGCLIRDTRFFDRYCVC